MIPKSFLLAALALLPTLFATAQEIKVDIGFYGKPLSQTWDTDYASWDGTANGYWTNTIGNSISNMFNGVTFTFTRVGPEGTSLQTDWYSAGIATAKLVNDGITVTPLHTQGNGGRIQLTMSGLSEGPHTLLTYHSTWQNPSTYSFSPINIYLNGTQVVTNMPVSNRVTNNADATYSYLEFNVTAGQDVVVLFAADTNNAATDKTVCINGFEVDTPNVKFKAFKPSPTPNDEHVDADATKSVLLTWYKAAVAASHNVYFGSSSNAVKNATTASPEFVGNQVATNLLRTNLSSLLTYWWRIDEVDATNGVTKGDLWMFRTRHLAFPGAEGYGRFARGGRGGVVVHVTNTNDSGPGSFRDAIEGNYGPRTVVFNVSGLITLSDSLNDIIIRNDRPYITVAGQTAPGKGICIKRQQFGLSGARDCIVRFMRIFVGKDSGETQNATGMAGVDHCIMDHCSFGWGIDEAISSRNAKNMTLQRCAIEEMLNIAGHQNYDPGTEHGYAASIGGEIASFHHNLLAHNEGRNWSLAGGLDANGRYAGSLDIFNNVVYNWGGRTTDGGAHRVNFVNNYYKPGAGSTIHTILNPQYGGFPGTQQYYCVGNVEPGYVTASNQTPGINIGTETGGTLPQNSTPPYGALTNAPFFPSYATIDEVTNAYKKVLSDVGCNQPMVDNHDTRVIRETIDGTYTYSGTGTYGGRPGMPNTTADVGGWEDYGNVVRPANWDTDNDGIPDWWEKIKGLNPNSPPDDYSDSNGDPDGDEYTNLEDYLNWLAEPHADCDASSFVDIDLTALTRGFTNNSPTYTVLTHTNGSASLIGVGNKTVRFTPNVSSNALGGFSFSVVDANGYNMTRIVNVRIIASTIPSAPVLGIRNQGGLMLELTGDNGSSLTVETKLDLGTLWSTWTNVTGNGAMQLLPLDQLTNESPRFFRAFAQ